MAKKRTTPKPEPETSESTEALSAAAEPESVSLAPAPAPVTRPDRTDLVLRSDCALGNGQRAAGDVLATFELADGVEYEELRNALHNPRLFQLKPLG